MTTTTPYAPIVPGDRVTLFNSCPKHPEVVQRNIGSSGAIIKRRKDGFYDILLDSGDTIKVSAKFIHREGQP